MSVGEELRAAAQLMRDPDVHTPAMHPDVAAALALLLEELGEHADHGAPLSLVLDGLAVARNYLQHHARGARPS